jgi:O-antigen/teichoic acid export membrane protein
LACAASALSLIINPCWSLLEGCNQIPAVEKFRFFNSLLSFLVSVLGYVAGFALYVGPVVALISLICSCAYLIIRWNLFFRNFLSPPSSVVISWSKEIWPFQWRIGISWMSGYLLFQAVVPIVFRLAGPAEAGKYGFTMALVNVVATISSSWATSKLPQYGMFVAQRDWLSLRSLWRAATFQSLCAAFLGSAMMLSLIPLISIYLPQLEHRYAGQGITAILCACMMAQNFISSCAYVLRAFKQEPYMWLSVIGALLNFLLIIIFTNFWGTLGAACAFALCNLIMFWPSFDVFRRKQREYVQGCSLI